MSAPKKKVIRRGKRAQWIPLVGLKVKNDTIPIKTGVSKFFHTIITQYNHGEYKCPMGENKLYLKPGGNNKEYKYLGCTCNNDIGFRYQISNGGSICWNGKCHSTTTSVDADEDDDDESKVPTSSNDKSCRRDNETRSSDFDDEELFGGDSSDSTDSDDDYYDSNKRPPAIKRRSRLPPAPSPRETATNNWDDNEDHSLFGDDDDSDDSDNDTTMEETVEKAINNTTSHNSRRSTAAKTEDALVDDGLFADPIHDSDDADEMSPSRRPTHQPDTMASSSLTRLPSSKNHEDDDDDEGRHPDSLHAEEGLRNNVVDDDDDNKPLMSARELAEFWKRNHKKDTRTLSEYSEEEIRNIQARKKNLMEFYGLKLQKEQQAYRKKQRIWQQNYDVTELLGSTIVVCYDDICKPMGLSFTVCGSSGGLLVSSVEDVTTAADQNNNDDDDNSGSSWTLGDDLAERGVTKHCAVLKSINGELGITMERFQEIKQQCLDEGLPMVLQIKYLLDTDAHRLWTEETDDISYLDSSAEQPVPSEFCDAPRRSQSHHQEGVARKPTAEEDQDGTANDDISDDDDSLFGPDSHRRNGPRKGEDHSTAADSPESSAESQSTKTQKHYRAFYNMYSELVSKEFGISTGRSSIHKNFALSQMWKRHKEKWGTTCGESCPCFYKIAFMTESIVTKMIEEKGSDWDNHQNLKPGDRPTGLTGTFAARFVPMLLKEYPKDNRAKILKRLLTMWGLHNKQRYLLGPRCTEKCDCLAYWDDFLRKGALSKEEEISNDAASAGSGQTTNFVSTVPRKRKATAAATLLSPAESKSPRLEGRSSMPSPKSRPGSPARVTTGHKAHRLPVSPRCHEYVVEFCSHRPIGLYFVTSHHLNSHCKIASVSPDAQKTDHRLQLDTMVVSAEIVGESVVTVTSHEDLRRQYRAAQAKSQALRIRFRNRIGSPEAIIDQESNSNEDWNGCAYTGALGSGWDGGASDMRVKEKESRLQIEKAKKKNLEAARKVPTRAYSKIRVAHSPPEKRLFLSGFLPYEFLKASDDDPAIHCQGETSEDPTGDASQDLPVDNSAVQSDTSQDLDNSMVQRDTSQSEGGPVERVRQKLLDITENGSIHHMLHFLRNGAFAEIDYSSCGKILEDSRKLVDVVKSKMRKNREDNQKKIDEIDLKAKLLNLYILAASVNLQSRAMDRWERVQIVIDRIEDIKLCEPVASSIAEHTLTVNMYIRHHKEVTMSTQLSPKPLGSVVMYEGGTSPITVDCNPLLSDDSSLVMTLNAKSPSPKIPSGTWKCLGVLSFPLAELHQICPPGDSSLQDDAWKVVSLECPQGLWMEGARVCLRARWIRGDICGKVAEKTPDRCQTVLDWIVRFEADVAKFNKQFGEDLKSNGAEVRTAYNMTPLHSAVYLKNPSLVQNALQLGADPTSQSKMGTALDLACSNNKENESKEEKIILSAVKALLETAREKRDVGPPHQETARKKRDVGPPHQEEGHRTALPIEQGKATTGHETLPMLEGKGSMEHGSMGHGSTGHETLPMLENPNWLLPDGRARSLCRSFEASHSCRFLRKCHFIHYHKPWGDAYCQLCSQYAHGRFPLQEKLFEDHVKTMKKVCDGRIWWTAGYSLLDTTLGQREIIYAEGGAGAHVSSPQHISWYSTREAAYDALRMSVRVALAAEWNNIRPATYANRPSEQFGNHYGPG